MKYYAYVGCRTTEERNARGKGLSIYEVSENKWNLKNIAKDLVNPSFLCFNNTEEYLYTVHGDMSEISSFKVEEDGNLKYLNTISTHGINPVHLSVDKSDKWIFVANLQSGSVAVIERKDDGSLGNLKNLYFIKGKEINTISHPHQVVQDNTRNFLLVSCQGRKKGFGQIVVYRINSTEGSLEEVCVTKSRELAEPRHLVFHENNSFCYGVNEKDYSVTFYEFDEKSGEIKPKQIITTLPSTYTGDGWASGIAIDKSNKFIIVSNRKHDSITSFKIEQKTGFLEFIDCVKTGGGQPRFITINPHTNAIFAANETTDSIVEFELYENGKFVKTNRKIETESPVCIIFSKK